MVIGEIDKNKELEELIKKWRYKAKGKNEFGERCRKKYRDIDAKGKAEIKK